MVRRSFYRRGRRELLIMRLRPALVWFLLLSLTRVAESDDCEGTAGHVKFCIAGRNLKLDSAAGSSVTVGWTFAGKTTNLPSRVTYEPPAEKKTLKLTGLTAADSGTYTATYGTPPSTTTEQFSILVGAVDCNAGQPCGVVKGSSIKMDSDFPSGAVSWKHQKLPDGAKTDITDAIKFTSSDKKEMGLFNVGPDNAGTYEATQGQTTKTFPVSVQAPITGVQIEGKAACAGSSVTLECKVTGDAKTVTWKKDETPTTANVADKKLTISVAKPADAAQYICHAKSYPGGVPKDSPAFTLSVSTAGDCAAKQNGTIAVTPLIIRTDGEKTPGAAQAASCSVALLLMTSLLHLCWML